MSSMASVLRPTSFVALLLASWLPCAAFAAQRLLKAEAVVAFRAPGACEVALTVAVAGADVVEHRLEVIDGAAVELLDVQGAQPERAATDIGRTRSLRLVPASPESTYTLRYRVSQGPSHPYRCPMWLPTAPADGRSRHVQIAVSIPDGAVAAATMPAFAWADTRGTAVLAHLPSVVVVPFTAAGSARSWDIAQVMDAAALATLVAATAFWLRQRKARP